MLADWPMGKEERGRSLYCQANVSRAYSRLYTEMILDLLNPTEADREETETGKRNGKDEK